MFERATRDESLFPPKCCQTVIELGLARDYLDVPLMALYQSKAREFGTKDRVYCYNPVCSAFLGGATAAATALRCAYCRAETCGSCKEAAHPDRTRCLNSEEESRDEALLAFAREQGWQRCPDCRYVVERTDGCFHMTCRCAKEFCYLCAATWKTCECPRFEDV